MKKVREDVSEKELIRKCVAGSRRHQKMLYERYSPKMFAICLRYAKNYHNAEDFLQEGFIKIFNKIHQFKGSGSFEGWMRRVFVNTVMEGFRRKVHMYPLTDVDGTDQNVVPEEIVDGLAREDLLNFISDLPEGYRTVFNLYAIEGYSHKEISGMLDIAEGTSKSQLARARNLLQKKLLNLKKAESEAHVR